MNSGVVFRWLPNNQNEIRKHRQNNGRTPNLQAYINKLHLMYIATKPGAALNNKAHGVFGYIYEPKEKKLLDCDELTLEQISERVGEMSKKEIDVFKTVISLREEDAIKYGYINRSSWKGLLELKINNIAREFKIPITDLEWTASYHTEAGHLHCHLLFWDRNQHDEDKNNSKIPYVRFENIRKDIAKEVFKEDYQKAILMKNISKQNIENVSINNLDLLYKDIKDKYKDRNEFNIIDTFKEENLINKIKKDLEVNKEVFLYDKSNPENFVQIRKVYQKKWNKEKKIFIDDINKEQILQFKNNGKNSLLYKENDFLEVAYFLTNFENIRQSNSLKEMQSIILRYKEKETDLNNILMEISPENVPHNIFSNKIKSNYLAVVTDMIAGLEKYIKEENKKALGTEKVNYRYGYQQITVKEYIDKISKLILKSSHDCNLAFKSYVKNCIYVQKAIGNIRNERDEKNVYQIARDELLNKMGNHILKMMKELRIEENEEIKKIENEKWNARKEEIELKEHEWNLRKQTIQKDMTRKMVENIFRDLSNLSNSSTAQKSRIKKEYGSLSKVAKKELAILKANSNGFEWFEN